MNARLSLSLLTLVFAQACACGPAVAIAIAPQTVTVEAGQSVTFSATVTGAADPTITWSVQEADGGAITGGGVYTAPILAGTFHVIAANGANKATATVTVVSAAQTLTVTPTTATLQTNGSQQFNATLDGSAPSVNWSVQEAGGGTVTPAGLYTAPATPGTYHLIATLAANSAVAGTATITVIPGQFANITLSPTMQTLYGGDTVTLTATVTNAANTSALFEVVELLGGTINATGPTTAIYTAPTTAGTYHVKATAIADPLAVANATFTVFARPVIVSVSPPSASVAPNGTQQFTAAVTGNTNTAVTWSVTGGGTISTTGLYTAPTSPGTNSTITATSVADTTAFGQARVAVLSPGGNTVTGTVAYSGAKPGRIYVSVESATQGTLGGTSLAAPGAFTIRGVQQNGAVTVRAWRDALGTATFNRPMDPVGTAALALPQTGGALTVTLTDPTPGAPTRPSQAPYVVGTTGAAAVFYAATYNQATGEESADHYRLYWSTTANPGPSNMAGMKEVKAGGNGFAVLFDAMFSSGSYFFSTSAVVNNVESTVNAAATATAMAQPAQGSTLQGTVSGFASADPLVILALGEFNGAYTISAQKILNPTASQAYSLTKVARGDYTLYAWVDSGNNGDWDPIDVGNFANAPKNVNITGAPNATVTLNASLFTADAIARPVSEHSSFFGSASYAVEHTVSTGRKQVVAVSVDSGPNLAGPMDLAMVGGATHSGSLNTASTVPTAATNYSYTVTYADTSTATVTGAVSAVLAGLPTPVSPLLTGGTTPTFSWTAPNPLPAQQPHTYALYLYDQNSQFSGYAVGLPAATTSLPWNQVLYAPAALSSTVTYYWYLYATDADGNRAATAAYFTAQ
jgi:hypothetical protein